MRLEAESKQLVEIKKITNNVFFVMSSAKTNATFM